MCRVTGEAEMKGRLSANDVFILGSYLECDLPDDNPLSPAPLIDVLRSHGYQVNTLGMQSTKAKLLPVIKRDADPPAITVADERHVWGLERKIVVYCDSDEDGSDARLAGRLRGFSRTTSLLIYILNGKTSISL